MNRKPKRGGGHQRPPDDSLLGASEVAGILGCDRSTISRFAKLGLFKPAVVEDGEVRWFDRKWIVLLAAHFSLKRAGRKRRARRTEEAAGESIFDANGDYRPELRKRRPSRAEAMNAPVSKSPTRGLQTPAETPTRDAPYILEGARSIGPRTQILPEWWDPPQHDPRSEARQAKDSPVAEPERLERTPSTPGHPPGAAPQAVPARTLTVIDPRWFDDDWKPEE